MIRPASSTATSRRTRTAPGRAIDLDDRRVGAAREHLVGLEPSAADGAAVGEQIVDGGGDGGAAHRGRAAGERADTVLQFVGVARAHGHALQLDAEPIGGDLCEQRLVALAGEPTSTSTSPSSSTWTSAHSYRPPERSTDSATPVPTSTSRASSRRRQLGRRRRPAAPGGLGRLGHVGDQLDRAIQAALEVAGVVRPAERGPVGELAHQVAAAQLDRVDAELAGGGVDRRLDQVARLGHRRRGTGRSGPCSCARR